MGRILDALIDRMDSGSAEYASVDYSHDRLAKASKARDDLTVHSATIRENDHLMRVKDAIYDGDIVVGRVVKPRGGLSHDIIERHLCTAIEDTDGHLARRAANEFIATPDGVTIGDTGNRFGFYVDSIHESADIHRAKDVVYSGDILLATLGQNLSKQGCHEVEGELATAAEEVEGDIARRSESELFLTPPGVSVSRSAIGGVSR